MGGHFDLPQRHSTAGGAHERSEGILGRLIDENEQAGELEHRGALTISRNHRARTLVFNYSAPTSDPMDVAAMKAANPASWISEQYLSEQAASPELTAAEVLQLHGCVWSALDQTWIDAETWDAAARPGQALHPGESIALGSDLSRTRDASAIVGCSLERALLVLLKLWERPPQLPRSADWSVRSDEVHAAMAELQQRFRVTRAYIDPAGWHTEIEEWERRYPRCQIMKWPTSATAKNGRALERFATDLRSGSLLHDGDVRLRRQVMTAQLHQLPRGGALLQKPGRSETDHIDAAVAATLAVEAAADSRAHDKPPGRAIFM